MARAGQGGGKRGMAKHRPEGQAPFMSAEAYGKSLKGLSVNLLVKDVPRALRFQTEVLGARLVYGDPDFAVVRFDGPAGDAPAEWMIHADHTYGDHPLLSLTGDGALRGVGIELRLHHCDPDAATARARTLGYEVFAPPADKPHGLREAYLIDPDGYMWVPDMPLRSKA